MDNSERLFAAILEKDFPAADKMLAAGVTLDGDIRDALVKGPTSAANFVLARYNYHKQFMAFAEKAPAEDFAAVAEKLFGLVAEPLFNNIGEYRYSSNFCNKFYDPMFFEAVLKFFNGKQMRKQMTMQEIIDNNSVELLELCAKYGWLKLPRIRDAMIDYATEENKTECTAFLLDFKNKNFDLAEERVKAEKKAERELNAAPDSVTALKQVWNWKKREDGSLMITNFKGDQTRISVPAMIGKSAVTAIGKEAFSPGGLNHRRDFFKTITEVTLPDSIVEIGEMAFNECAALRAVNIPEGVSEIKNHTFANCFALESIVIPSSVKAIGDFALFGCETLKTLVIPEGVESIGRLATCQCRGLETVELPSTLKKITEGRTASDSLFYFSQKLKNVIVPRGSYAEEYCAKNNIAFEYKED